MRIAVVGLGYVGLPLSLEFVKKGCEVVGLDTDERKIGKLSQGQSYIKHIASSEVKAGVDTGRFSASASYQEVENCDAVIICVPTPLNIYREPDLTYVLQTGQEIGPHMRKGTLVVLESTTYPGTTEDELRSELEATSGMKAGRDFHLAFSPEREDPGNQVSRIGNIPKVVGGYTEKCLERAVALYSMVVDEVVPVSSCKEAEATKLLENIFRCVNIGMINELKMVFDAMGIDIWEVIRAANTKPFGFMPFYPGPGLGGHCIPIDPFYLSWKARQYHQHTRFIELAGEINTAMPDYVLHRVIDALNNDAKAVKGSRILLLGLAYKANVDDDRESPSYLLMEKLRDRGAELSYNDPHIPEIRSGGHHSAFGGMRSVDISDAHDLILVMTAHDEYKAFDFSSYDTPVVDTRNALTKRPAKYYKA